MSGSGRLLLRIVAVGALVLSVACGNGATTSSGSGARVAGGTVTARLSGDWTTGFDPAISQSLYGGEISMAVYDRLVDIGPNNTLVPYLAKSWKITPTSVTFTLRNDATCSDGTKMTPSVVAASFARLIKSAIVKQRFGPGPYAVSSDDAAGTFTLTVGTPYSDLIWGFTTNNGSVVCPAAAAGSPATAPIGSGAYTLASAVHSDEAVLKLRPDWKWGPGGMTAADSGMPQELDLKVITNDTTAANLLLTGGLDFADVAGPDVTRLLGEKSLESTSYVGSYTNELLFNPTGSHPTADPQVRLALMTAVDQKAWSQAAYAAYGVTSPSFLTPGTPCYDASTSKDRPTPSVARARSILLADGYAAGPDGKLARNGKPLTISLVGTPSLFATASEYLQSVWEQAGMTVKLQDLDYPGWTAILLNGNDDAITLRISSTSPAPGSSIAYFTGTPPPAGINFTQADDPAVDAEIKAAESTSGNTSCQHWSNVQRLLLQDRDVLPLATPKVLYFAHSIAYHPTQTFIEFIGLRRTA